MICQGITKSGTKCKLVAVEGSYCSYHEGQAPIEALPAGPAPVGRFNGWSQGELLAFVDRNKQEYPRLRTIQRFLDADDLVDVIQDCIA